MLDSAKACKKCSTGYIQRFTDVTVKVFTPSVVFLMPRIRAFGQVAVLVSLFLSSCAGVALLPYYTTNQDPIAPYAIVKAYTGHIYATIVVFGRVVLLLIYSCLKHAK